MADGVDHNDWFVGQRIQVTCTRSKHFGRFATVIKVHRTRLLELEFEDGRPGKNIDRVRASTAPIWRVNEAR
jgi:hypothetical protein